jgi:catalase
MDATTPNVPPDVPAAIVVALKTNAGNPKGVRASFAKGQCVVGSYTPAKEAASITKSKSFTTPGKVLGRFSVGGGNPKVPDTNRVVLRGISLHIGEGKNATDMLFENAPVHFAKSTAQMLEFLTVRTPGPDGKSDAAKVKAFSADNPETLNQANYVAAHPVPGSFAGITYFGIHAWPVTNAKGASRFVKLEVVPVGPEVTMSDEEAKGKAEDFLMQDLKSRIGGGGMHFKVVALLDKPGDPTMDVTTRWPDEDSRQQVTVGTIDITGLSENAPCDDTIFNPGTLAAGVAEPPDEIFAARKIAYAVSLARRKTELAQP